MRSRELGGAKSKLIDVLTCTMARAIIRTSGTLTALALVPLKALAFTSLSVAQTLVGTLCVSVASVINSLGKPSLGIVHPGQLKGADSIRAVAVV